mgnify:FL=1
MINAALDYSNRGLSVIPIRPDKKPFIKWELYQKQRASGGEIREWWVKWPKAMIGIVTGSISGIVVIDVDDCDKGMQALSEYLTTDRVPTAKTPGGGYHLYFKAPKECLRNSTGTPPGVDFRGEGGYIIAPPSQNGVGKKYEWLKGLGLDEVEPPALPRAYIKLLINSFKHVLYKGDVTQNVTERNKAYQSVTKRNILFNEGTRDETLFHIAYYLVKGGMPQDEMQQVIETIAQKCCDPPFPLDEAREKIASALKRADRKERNLTQVIRDWIGVTNGNFSVTNLYKEIQSVTSEEKTKVRVILGRLVKEGLIERVGNEDGHFRRIESDYTEIDLLAPRRDDLNLKWPFEIERYVRTLPKNIIVIAGTPEAGKTAFLLNVVKDNMKRFKIRYLSSEMGQDEIIDRITLTGLPLEEWKRHCTFIERSSNFSDLVLPDDVNIIDFIEIHEDFWKIGAIIKGIADKLNFGVAIIALQKKHGQDLARGGLGTVERPRLYLAIDSGKLKIVKAKNWVDSKINPNDLEISFKLVDGCKFIKIGDWHKPVEIPSPYRETEKQFNWKQKNLF